jgi:hypothetical protein
MAGDCRNHGSNQEIEMIAKREQHKGAFVPAGTTWRKAALVVALLAGAPAGHAAIVSNSLSFTASGFPSGSPQDPVTGAVSYSFDNTATFLNQVDGATANGAAVSVSLISLSLAGTWTPVLTYIQALDVLAIGNGPTTVVTAGTNDWRFAVTNVSTNPVFREFVYSNAGATTSFLTTTGTVSAVPEPGSAWLLLGGLGSLAFLRPRRAVADRRKA